MSSRAIRRPDVQDSGCGFTIPNQLSLEAFRSALKYKPRPNDLFIVTYSKCGTSWVQNIVGLILRRGLPFESGLDFFRDFPYLEMTGEDGPRAIKGPGAIKMHQNFHRAPWSDQSKYIFVIRNPKDCCVSFYHHMRNRKVYNYENAGFDDFFELFMRGEVNFGDYFDQLCSWYEQKDRPNVLLVTYEEIKADQPRAIFKLADFLGREYREMLENNPQILNDVIERSSFQYMKDHFDRQMADVADLLEEVGDHREDIPKILKDRYRTYFTLLAKGPDSFNYVRKGLVGDWRNYFSKEQSERMDEKFKERTKGTNIPELWKGILQY